MCVRPYVCVELVMNDLLYRLPQQFSFVFRHSSWTVKGFKGIGKSKIGKEGNRDPCFANVRITNIIIEKITNFVLRKCEKSETIVLTTGSEEEYDRSSLYLDFVSCIFIISDCGLSEFVHRRIQIDLCDWVCDLRWENHFERKCDRRGGSKEIYQ